MSKGNNAEIAVVMIILLGILDLVNFNFNL